MLSRAVQRHERENFNSQGKTAPQTLFSSSQPHQQSQQKPLSSVPFGHALKPAVSSTLNAQHSNHGIKRMANGLAKVLDGAFDDDSSKRYLNANKDTKKSKPEIYVIEDDPIDENAFDSDVELDYEEPKSTLSYPRLPQKQAAPGTPNPIVYPTLPRQQQVQTSCEEEIHEPSELHGASSFALPWSSSPAQHFEPAQDPPSTKRFVFSSQQSQPTRSTASAQAKATARRTLPWTRASPGATESASRSEYVSSKSNAFTTPAPKRSEKPAHPWNTSASGIKEQQKKHREEGRKAVKMNAATSESISTAKSQRKKVPRVFLSDEQQHVLDLVVEQKSSVFFTGSAGTGKSVLLREIISSLRRRYDRESDRVAVTASTGLAACNVGGMTLHSFAGIGLGKEDVPELVRKIKRNAKAKHRWMRTKVLVIDEVSMVDADLFDKLEAVARQLRNNGRPFGGIQLVITGDFFQLPPVPDSGRVAKFSFDAATWTTTIKHTIGLHQVFRQKDPIFAGMLNEMREGRLSEASIKAFKNLSRDLKFEDAISATELFPLRTEVERANTERLSMLQGQCHVYEARDGGSITEKVQRDKLLQNCMAPETITLKKGAQVMLIKNVDEHLVNGSIGRVIAFMDEGEFEKFSINEDVYAQHSDGVFVSQDQEAMSREERARKRIQENLTTSRLFPLVRFTIADGTSRDLLCQPEAWKVEQPNGEVQASRSQIPLILAWALSIHKAQGQTLERVKVDLGKVFEKGQAYVALSRATSMAGLQVLRFDPRKVNAHERVRTFYANLARVQLENSASKKPKVEDKRKHLGALAADYENHFLEDATDI